MKSWQEVEGFFDYPYIYGPAADGATNGATLVEVGSWLGQSMAFLAQRLKARNWTGTLVSVDTFKGEANQPAHYAEVAACGGSIRAKFEQNMRDCGVAEMVTIIESDSALAADSFADASVDFCFIDAAHDYASVVRDLLAWTPKIKAGGVIAGHDYPHPDVHRAVMECFAGSGPYTVVGACWFRICGKP